MPQKKFKLKLSPDDTNSDEFIVKSTDTPIELEKFNNSSINNFSLEQDKMRHYYIADSSHKNLSKLSVNKLHKLLLEVQKVNKEMIRILQLLEISGNCGKHLYRQMKISHYPIF